MIVNVHERVIPVSSQRCGEILDSLGSANDEFWHSDLVEPLDLTDGLTVGSRGGHGPVRYRVVEHRPGHLVRFEFDPRIGLIGEHRLEVIDQPPGPDGQPRALMRHTISAQTAGRMKLLWPLVERVHDGALEDMLDHVEREASGVAHRQQQTPTWVRKVAGGAKKRRVGRTKPREDGLLARDRGDEPLAREREHTPACSLDRVDVADCFATPLLAADSDDPLAWSKAIFGRSVRGVDALMRLRNVLARPFGFPPTQRLVTGFPVLATTPSEAVLGTDERHMNFRVAVNTEDHQVSLTTQVQINTAIGRLYWGVVRWFHGPIARKLMATVPVARDVAGRSPNLPDAPSRSERQGHQ